MDIYQALEHDHNQLKPLLESLVKASEMDANTKIILDQIRDLLVPHSRAEEAAFYNPLKSLDETKDVVSHGFREHVEAEVILRTLRGLEKINIEWTKAAQKLRDAVFHHIREEESEIFAAARKVITEEEARQLAVAFQQAKLKAQEQGDLKNTIDLVANLLPSRFTKSKDPELSASA